MNEWISVKERLPHVTGKYICCTQDTNGNLWTICATFVEELSSWFGDFGEVKNKVTYWMPLPEPPEEG